MARGHRSCELMATFTPSVGPNNMLHSKVVITLCLSSFYMLNHFNHEHLLTLAYPRSFQCHVPIKASLVTYRRRRRRKCKHSPRKPSYQSKCHGIGTITACLGCKRKQFFHGCASNQKSASTCDHVAAGGCASMYLYSADSHFHILTWLGW